MPNHFTVVGLCARNRERMNELGYEEIDFSKLKEINLCKAVMPMPKELNGIVASHPTPCRYRHRATGQFSDNCDGEMGIEFEKVVLSDNEIAQLKKRFGAASWYEWCPANWGTKWGTYDLNVTELTGDGLPVLIEFQCAWSPPKPNVMKKINTYLNERYCLTDIRWIGYDPADGRTCDIYVT